MLSLRWFAEAMASLSCRIVLWRVQSAVQHSQSPLIVFVVHDVPSFVMLVCCFSDGAKENSRQVPSGR
jgi:hypothetical protein